MDPLDPTAVNSQFKDLQDRKRDILRGGGNLLDLSMINPDLPPPRELIDKLVESAVRPGLHRYAVARGVSRLRSAFAEKYAKAFDVQIESESEVCVTFGSKDGVLHALMSLPDNVKAKPVLVGKPTYPAHLAALKFLGYETMFFDVSHKEDQMLDEISGLISKGAVGSVLLNFPNNPTGVSIGSTFWSTLVEMAKEAGVFLLNDFVYGELLFSGKPAPSLLAADPEYLVSAEVYSLSKAYSVPGWRVGGLLGNRAMIESVSNLKSRVDYGLFLPLQHAAAEALMSGASYAEGYAQNYARRAKTLVEGLGASDWQAEIPAGGCCVWAELPKNYQGSDQTFVKELLERCNVAVLPGTVFGKDFERFIRIALVHSEERLRTVLTAFDRTLNVK